MIANITEIFITGRIIRIGFQVFPIRNIARIQTLHFVGKPSLSGGHIVLVLCACLLVAIGIALSSSRNGAAAGVLLVMVGVVAFVATLVHGSKRRIHEFVLAIETSGGHSTALSSSQYEPIRELEYHLISAIDNPPSTEMRLAIGNLSLNNNYDLRGAQGIQVGQGNSQRNAF